MRAKSLRERTDSAQRRIQELAELVGTDPEKAVDRLAETLGHVQTTLEELWKTCQELGKHNEALAFDLQAAATDRDERVFNSVPGAYVVTDHDGTIGQANLSACALMGVKAEELIGKPLASFVASEDADSFLARLTGVVDAGRADTWNVRLQPPHGEQFEASVTVGVARGGWATTTLCWLIRDVTEREEGEKKLRESAATYRSIVENANDVLMLTRPDGIVTYLSPACEAVLGYAASDLVGTVPWIIHPADADSVKRAFRAALRGESGSVLRYRVRTKTGETRWISHSWAPIASDGNLEQIVSIIRDVTEHMGTEEALREERDLAQQYLDVAEVILLVIDANEQVRLMNRKGCNVLGYREDEAIGKNWFDVFIPARLREDVRRVFRRLIAGEEQPFEYFENPILLKSGEERIIAWHNAILRDQHDNIIATLSSGEDVTERRRTEEQLRESEERFHTLFERAPLGYQSLDEEGHFIEVNQTWLDTLGYSREEVIGKWFGDFLAPEFVQAFRERFPLFKAAGKLYSEFQMLHKNGERRFIAFEGRIGYTPEGRFKQTHCILQDVSERKRTEEALRESEEKYRALVESSVVGIGVSIGDGILYANPALLAMHGYDDLREFASRPLLDYATPQSRAFIQEWRQRRARGEPVPYVFEHEIVRKDGTVRTLQLCVAPLTKGNPPCATGAVQTTFIDITERKQAEEESRRLEEQLRHSQKMDAVGQLAAGVAHDFNNVLTVILGNVEFLLTGMRGEAPVSSAAATIAGLEQIGMAAERAALLTRRLLAFGRKGVVNMRVLDPNRIIAGVEGLLSSFIGKHIALDVRPAPDIAHIRADAGQFEQVIMNLVLNARDAMPSGGTVTIDTANVSLSAADCADLPEAQIGPHVMLAVSDTGVGMSPKTLSRAFEPFFTTKALGKGTGLGLATVYGIVKQSGGHIRVESTPGKGSTFRIYFPTADEAEVKPTAARSSKIPTGTETILVCEDDQLVRQLACTALQSAGYTVIEAEGGKQALELAVKHAGVIHLLVSDVMLLDVNGPQLAETLGTQRPEMQVLFVSGYARDLVDKHGLRVGRKNFLEKPFGAVSLVHRVREILDRAKS